MMKEDTKKKHFRKIISAYHSAAKRLIFLDYDGTLVDFHDEPHKAIPDQELLLLLHKLAQMNHLVIISGRTKEELQQWFGALPLSLAAEHGFWIKDKNRTWKAIHNIGREWKKEIYPCLSHYVDMTPHSFIEEKEGSLVWHYRKAAGNTGAAHALRVQEDLEHLLRAFGLQVLQGHKTVEIKDPGIHKGIAVKRWLDQYSADFLMAIGDDRTDEDTFEAIPAHGITIKVGPGPSAAGMSLENPAIVRELLEYLTKKADNT